jgi:hypothetical protein
MWAWTLGSASVPKSIWPPIRSVTNAPTPLYGMWRALAPISPTYCSPVRCRIVPLPPEP